MQVRATKRGFFGHLRESGATFEVPESQFSSNWMEVVEEPKKKRTKEAQED